MNRPRSFRVSHASAPTRIQFHQQKPFRGFGVVSDKPATRQLGSNLLRPARSVGRSLGGPSMALQQFPGGRALTGPRREEKLHRDRPAANDVNAEFQTDFGARPTA